MNKVFRFLGLGALAVAFTAAGAATSFAQDPCADSEIPAKTAKYEEFTKNYAGKTSVERKAALNAAKEYVEKYGACVNDKQQIDYFKEYIPKAEKDLGDLVKFEETQKTKAILDPLYTRFNAGLKAKNWDEVYASGKELLKIETNETNLLDLSIVMGQIGFDEMSSEKKNNKYNADTVLYAQQAIQKIEGGTPSKNYGVAVPGSNYSFLDKKYTDTKANTLGWLNYIIGYIKFNGDKNEKDALPYLYKATQYNSGARDLPNGYQGIGSYFFKELAKLEEKRVALLKANNNVDTDETKAIYALQKGYAERAFDGYSKAYNFVPADPKNKAYKDSLYEQLKSIYLFRYNGKKDGLDPAIASSKAKPLVNPTTEVTPIVEEAPTTTPTTDTTGTTKPAVSTTTPAPTAPATTKPATTTTAKPATTTTPAKTTTATKAPVKKPAPKKKGTR
jgi:hypothetical protein